MHATKTTLSLALAISGLALGGCGGGVDDEADVDFAESESAVGTSHCPDAVPPEVDPAADQKLKLVLHAEGDQVYECRATATGFAWALKEPDADLIKPSNGKVVGTHYAGPTWAHDDGSAIVATRLAGITVDPTAIPWLLLGAVSNTGDGKMSEVTSIQRMNTTGGLAPASGCDASTVGGPVVRVPYTADYFFYEATSGKHPAQCASE
jgi:hypothetical protein